MKDTRCRNLLTGIVSLTVFASWTVLIRHIDVQNAGPNGTEIGFATINVWFHSLTGVHMLIYTITDWLGLVPVHGVRHFFRHFLTNENVNEPRKE